MDFWTQAAAQAQALHSQEPNYGLTMSAAQPTATPHTNFSSGRPWWDFVGKINDSAYANEHALITPDSPWWQTLGRGNYIGMPRNPADRHGYGNANPLNYGSGYVGGVLGNAGLKEARAKLDSDMMTSRVASATNYASENRPSMQNESFLQPVQQGINLLHSGNRLVPGTGYSPSFNTDRPNTMLPEYGIHVLDPALRANFLGDPPVDPKAVLQRQVTQATQPAPQTTAAPLKDLGQILYTPRNAQGNVEDYILQNGPHSYTNYGALQTQGYDKTNLGVAGGHIYGNK